MNQSGRVITPISRARILPFSRSERVGGLPNAGENVIGATGPLVSRGRQNRANSAPAAPNLSGRVPVVGTKNTVDVNADVIIVRRGQRLLRELMLPCVSFRICRR